VRLFQFIDESGALAVGVSDESGARTVAGGGSLYSLVRSAIAAGHGLQAEVERAGAGAAVDLRSLQDAGRIAAPITHPDPAHLHLTGTGLTHLGSAATRDSMHREAEQEETELTDSMKMFRMGLEGGKPAAGEVGVQPEWFYKGNGSGVAQPGGPIVSPWFALDAGEEPEVAGIYVISDDGTPFRVGFALSNEFSDHITERQNYLYLAHSKIRQASFGPEILVGELPASIEGTSRIVRGGNEVWSKPFLSGEDNMSHTIANLEHHHFKYDLFRQPGDVHVHMFGTATLSFADGVTALPGDTYEIAAPEFGLPLRNTLHVADRHAVEVRAL